MTRGPRALPLSPKGVDRYRFGYAVFLLNTNIEQLMYSQGLTVIDLRNTLPNLKSLILALSYDPSHSEFTALTLSAPPSLFLPRDPSPLAETLSSTSDSEEDSNSSSSGEGRTTILVPRLRLPQTRLPTPFPSSRRISHPFHQPRRTNPLVPPLPPSKHSACAPPRPLRPSLPSAQTGSFPLTRWLPLCLQRIPSSVGLARRGRRGWLWRRRLSRSLMEGRRWWRRRRRRRC
ncbi:hypothetical protein BCR35DRAFT_192899 [Leucosporidium creatinivorum]|uniref:Uncharacterized protein n=1 Tax=Leucosporidium creatinivorum TaxID=106004 RepID=A0A1Y2G2K6_9BASI|nr:hypothetical protein BCR35DRAFT_192899 [Leucosporidium creatinivorum]